MLTDTYLYYFKTKEDDQAAGMIPVLGCLVRDASEKTGKKFSFEIRSKDRGYLIYADSQQEMEQWLSKIVSVSRPKSDHSNEHWRDGETIMLSVKGMMCDHCEERVKQILARVPGVQHFDVDTNEEVVTVSGKVDVTELCINLEEAGYLPSVQT